jgi:hypothetical protein
MTVNMEFTMTSLCRMTEENHKNLGKSSQYPVDTGWEGPTSQSAHSDEKKNPCPYQKSNTSCPAHS